MSRRSHNPDASLASIEKRLALYGLAATAAVASGIPSSADADMVVLDLTGQPVANRTTPVNGFLYFDITATSAGSAYGTSPVGAAPFQLRHYSKNPSGPGHYASGKINPSAGGNAVAISAAKTFAARRFTSGFVGGAGTTFAAPGARMIGGSKDGNAPKPAHFSPGDSGYLGLQFVIGSDTHYGWAGITLNGDSTVTLNSLGYENVADMAALIVPEPSSIALLALGAAGIAALRRQQRKAA